MPDIAIDNMLADFGLAASEYRKARAALFEWEIIQKTPDRKNIAAHKADLRPRSSRGCFPLAL